MQQISTGFVFVLYWVIFVAAGMISIIIATYLFRRWLKPRRLEETTTKLPDAFSLEEIGAATAAVAAFIENPYVEVSEQKEIDSFYPAWKISGKLASLRDRQNSR